MLDSNPYKPPTAIPKRKDSNALNREKFKHRNFRLTMDEVHENRHFVIGNLRAAMLFAFIQQCVWMVFMTCVLDGGRLLNDAALSALVFWAMTLTTAVIQQGQLTNEQNLAVKWGYLPVFLIVINLAHLIRIVGELS